MVLSSFAVSLLYLVSIPAVFSTVILSHADCLIIVILGRHIFDNYITTDRKVHDIYSFALGLYLMWFFAVAFDWTAKHKQQLIDNGWHISGTDIKEVATKYGSVVSKLKKYNLFGNRKLTHISTGSENRVFVHHGWAHSSSISWSLHGIIHPQSFPRP